MCSSMALATLGQAVMSCTFSETLDMSYHYRVRIWICLASKGCSLGLRWNPFATSYSKNCSILKIPSGCVGIRIKKSNTTKTWGIKFYLISAGDIWELLWRFQIKLHSLNRLYLAHKPKTLTTGACTFAICTFTDNINKLRHEARSCLRVCCGTSFTC